MYYKLLEYTHIVMKAKRSCLVITPTRVPLSSLTIGIVLKFINLKISKHF